MATTKIDRDSAMQFVAHFMGMHVANNARDPAALDDPYLNTLADAGMRGYLAADGAIPRAEQRLADEAKAEEEAKAAEAQAESEGKAAAAAEAKTAASDAKHAAADAKAEEKAEAKAEAKGEHAHADAAHPAKSK
jgi:hypothetical protein